MNRKEIKPLMKRLLFFLAPYKVNVILAILIGAVGSFMNILIPNQINTIASLVQAGIGGEVHLKDVGTHALLAVGIIAVMFLCNLFYGRRMEDCAQKTARDIRTALNDKMNRLSLKSLDALSAGDLITRTSTDVQNVGIAISKSLGTLVMNLILFFGAILFMIFLSPLLSLVVIGSVLLGSGLCTFVSGKIIPRQRRQREALSGMNAQIDEALSGYVVIKSFNAEQAVLESFRDVNASFSSELKKSQFLTNILTPLMTLVNNLTYILICVMGAWMILRGDAGVNIGTIVAFILYAKMLSSPLSYLAGIMGMLSQTFVSLDRISQLLDLPENEDEGRTLLPEPRGEVRFQDVRFGYAADHEIIHGFSAVVKPGMKVAIVGPTGAGKSTLVNLLMRFYETDSGSILIDGTDVRDIPRRRLHTLLGMVLQETFLFTGTIRDNIVYATPDVTEEMLQDVIRKCGLEHLISSLPEGLDTMLVSGSAVSAGQRQLLTIARTMLRNPDILILDEATSSIDTRTELLIQKALDALSKGRTSFVIAHRLSTIRNADIIFVLKDGDIVETGTHEELLRRDGLYTELYRSQFEES